MLEAWGLFALGLVLLALGGDTVVKGASALAQRFGATPFTAGLLLMAFATSLPELAVNLRAIALGAPDLALGNAVGSNIVNFGLTLAVAALAAPLLARLRLLSLQLVLLAAATLAVMLCGLDGVLGRIEGAALLAAFAVMLVVLCRRGRRESAEVQAGIAEYAQARTVLWLNLLRVVMAVVLLYLGANFTTKSALVLGPGLGLSPLLVGLLPVAIGTALPETAAAVAAARRGQGDMVLGHVLGSSLFNLLVVVGGMALLQPLALPASFVKLELPAAIAFVLVLYPMLRGDLRISRGEGAVLLVAFIGWVVLELAQLTQ